MRKLLCIFAVISLFSCSKEDDNNSSNSINPPDWILGTWLIDDSAFELGWKFTSNDVVIIQIGGIQISQKGNIDFYLENGQEASTTEEYTNETYSLKLILPAGQSVTYNFTKISNTEIQWDGAPNQTYYKQ